jgi:HSP20 family protein
MAQTATVPAKSENGHPRRRDPFEMFETIQEDMGRLWSQTWPFGAWPLTRRTSPVIQSPARWAPRVDVFEKDGSLVVTAELPGAQKEDIEVTLDQGDLVIRGERKAESEVKEAEYYRMERSYGSFYRRLPLPFETTADQIQATYKSGVLEVRIPKPATVDQPKAQPITIS